MALTGLRAASSLTRQISRRSPAAAGAASTAVATEQTRSLTTTPPRHRVTEDDSRPRWSFTPEAMKGKFRINEIKDISRTEWTVNEDPDKLNSMYTRFLGPSGDTMLPDEIKWLAVTHKSFDQGRRGFNDRLAYFGRSILVQEAAQYILSVDEKTGKSLPPDKYRSKRQPFRDPALDRSDNFARLQPSELLNKDRIAKLGVESGINHVMRWKPRFPENLNYSGIDVVINSVVYAIVGAIALQHGAATASKIVRERILRKMHNRSAYR